MTSRIVAVLAIVAVAVVAVFVLAANGSGDGGSDGYGDEISAPGVVGEEYGTIVLISESNGNARYRAVPCDGAFVGWFDGTRYLSDAFELSRASFDGITAMFAESDVKTVSYSWSSPLFAEDGSLSELRAERVFTLEIPRVDYYRSISSDAGRQATYADPMPVHRLSDDAVVDATVAYLEPLVAGQTDYQKATVLLAFVQAVIKYQSDWQQYGAIEFWTTPMETLYSGYGDCEDTAALFVNLAVRLGLDCGFVAFEDPVMGHMSAAVAVGDVGGASFVIDGVRYTYAETALDGVYKPVGFLSSSLDISDGKWTRVTHDDSGYISGKTVPIGVSSTGNAISFYGVKHEQKIDRGGAGHRHHRIVGARPTDGVRGFPGRPRGGDLPRLRLRLFPVGRLVGCESIRYGPRRGIGMVRRDALGDD